VAKIMSESSFSEYAIADRLSRLRQLAGKGIPMTKGAWKRMRAEAAKIIQSQR
jgi:hypothetical protein